MELRPATRSPAQRAGNATFAPLWLALLGALGGCGSPQDLIIGDDLFTLEKRDDFDGAELDLNYWELATHTFDANLAWFSPNNAKVADGLLVLSITADVGPAAAMPGQATKPYSAAEVRTRTSFQYGRFRARARFAPGFGVVSAFWGFYDRYSASSGPQLDNQIVIESGLPRANPDPVLRYLVNVPGGAGPPVAYPAGFDPSAAFHLIGYDWTPSEVRFYLDGDSRLVVSGEAAAQLTQYQRLVLSAYPSRADWISDFDPGQLPVTAEFDWVELYGYNGRRP